MSSGKKTSPFFPPIRPNCFPQSVEMNHDAQFLQKINICSLNFIMPNCKLSNAKMSKNIK
jgi:hypothetical protein